MVELDGFCFFSGDAEYGDSCFSLNAVGFMEEMPAAIVDRPQGTGDFLLMMFHHQVQVLTDSGLVDVQPGGLMI